MRKGISQKKLNRTSSHRKALFFNMSCALLTHEQIVTTLPKAKALRPVLERYVTKAKNAVGDVSDLSARRFLLSKFRNYNKYVSKLFDLGERYKDRNGGYIRIIKANYRKGDDAPMAIIEFVDRDKSVKGSVL